ncbi:MAG: hypothetical protein ACLTSZ_03890 [Lachnospiraceae bacterium]
MIPRQPRQLRQLTDAWARAVAAVKEVDGQMFICADHGNAETDD